MSKSSKKPDRVIAHVRWLEAPYFGRAAFLVERNGQYGYVPATETDQRFEGFVAGGDPALIEKAFGELPKRKRRKP